MGSLSRTEREWCSRVANTVGHPLETVARHMIDLSKMSLEEQDGFFTDDCEAPDERATIMMALQRKPATKWRWDSAQLKHWEDICSEHSVHAPNNTPTDEISPGLIDEIDRGLQDETLGVFSPHSELFDWTRLLEELEKMEREYEMPSVKMHMMSPALAGLSMGLP